MASHALRPATLADVDPVAALLREVGFKPRSEAGWRWLFHDNPALRHRASPPDMGWVLERGGTIDGYLANIQLDYVIDGRPLRAAADHAYYVRPAARAHSIGLMSAFYRQKDVDLFINTTANPASGRVYRLFKSAPPEDRSFYEGLLWVGDDRTAVRDALMRRRLARSAAGGLALLAAPLALIARSILGFATLPRKGSGVVASQLRPDKIDARFDCLWELVANAPGLKVRRDAERLRWYLSDPDARSEPPLFVTEDAEGLTGYALVAHHCPSGDVTTQLVIVDFVVRPGAEHVSHALLAAVLAHARRTKVGLVRCGPCGLALSRELKALRPYIYREPGTSHLVKAGPNLQTHHIVARGVWHATGLDGDMPFCIE